MKSLTKRAVLLWVNNSPQIASIEKSGVKSEKLSSEEGTDIPARGED